jgi:hypothetical protein
MYVMKILYIASIYGLVRARKKISKKKFIAVLMKKPLQIMRTAVISHIYIGFSIRTAVNYFVALPITAVV